MAIYLSGVYAVVGLPAVDYIRFVPTINMQPFMYMFSDFTNSFLNVLLFVPLGVFLPLLWDRFKNPLRALLFGLAISASIEFLQLFTFRVTDINDLITNTFGTLVGWSAGRILRCFVTIPDDSGRKLDVYTLIGISFGVMYFLQPLIEMLTHRMFT